MPLFGNKFSPKKTPLRKSPSLSNLNLEQSEKVSEFGLNNGPLRIKLGQNEMVFEDGQWIAENGGGANQKELVRSKRQNQQLGEENNLLKIKIELLLDMLSERTAEVHLQENEIDQLKRMVKKR